MKKLKERIARSPLDLKVFKKFPYESDWKFRQNFFCYDRTGCRYRRVTLHCTYNET